MTCLKFMRLTTIHLKHLGIEDKDVPDKLRPIIGTSYWHGLTSLDAARLIHCDMQVPVVGGKQP